MPHLISNPGSRQSHPLYKNNCSCKHHNMKNIDGASNTEKEKSPEKTESIPRTYDAIKNASAPQASMGRASTKPLGRK